MDITKEAHDYSCSHKVYIPQATKICMRNAFSKGAKRMLEESWKWLEQYCKYNLNFDDKTISLLHDEFIDAVCK